MEKKSFKYSLISISPYLFFLVTWFIIRNIVLTTIPIRVSWESIGNIFSVTGFYTFKSLFPLNLSISINTRDVFSNPVFFVPGLLIVIAVIIVAVMFTFKRTFKNKVFFAIVAFYLLLFPSLAVLFIPTANSLAAWRFLYAPSAILIGILSYLLSKWIPSRRILFPVLVCICIIYTIEIYPKNTFYGQKERDFWVNMKNIKRESLIAQFNAASAILFVNEEKALSIYDHIIKTRKNHPGYENYKRMIQENLAAYYASKGELQKAKHYFESVIKMNKASGIEFHFNYAFFLYLTGDESRAKSIVTHLLHTNPNDHNVLFMASRFYIRIKEYKTAIRLLTKDYLLFNRSESLRLLNVLKKNMPPQINNNR
jgi:tetratricopeptide (TPR) repeat protein